MQHSHEPLEDGSRFAQGFIVYVDTFREDVKTPDGGNPAVTGLLGKWTGTAMMGSLAHQVKDCGSQAHAMACALEALAKQLREHGWPAVLIRKDEANG